MFFNEGPAVMVCGGFGRRVGDATNHEVEVVLSSAVVVVIMCFVTTVVMISVVVASAAAAYA